MDPRVLLLGTLEDLTSQDLKKFQWYLSSVELEGFQHIPKGKLEKCGPTDTVDTITETYGRESALRITLLMLRKMSQNDLANKLETEMEKR